MSMIVHRSELHKIFGPRGNHLYLYKVKYGSYNTSINPHNDSHVASPSTDRSPALRLIQAPAISPPFHPALCYYPGHDATFIGLRRWLGWIRATSQITMGVMEA